MLSKRPTLIHWIIIWAVLSIGFHMANTDWGEIASVISAIILVAGILIVFGKWYYRKWQLNDPLNIISTFKGSTSSDVQYLLLHLATKTKITIESMCLYFTNERYEDLENIPTIKGLYHCLSAEILKDSPIPHHSIINNRWFWLEQPVFQQSIISIALSFVAKVPFDGILKIDLKCAEVNRIIYDIPFKVTEVKTFYNDKGKKGSLIIKHIKDKTRL